MTIENASPTPNTPELNTENVEDYSQRQQMVYDAAVAERKAGYRTYADDVDTDEVAEAVADANEVDTPAPPAKAKEEPKPAPVEVKEPTPEELKRKASLANAARLERESVKRSTELAAKSAEIKAKEEIFATREAKLAAFEKAYSDPDALLALLAEKVTPEKMSQFFIESGDPAKVAERRAKAALASATEPVNSEVAKLREEMKALKDESDKHKAAAARASSEKDFAARVLDNKEKAPHAARMLSKRPKDFFALADTTATQLMAAAEAEGRVASWDDVIQDVNKQLAEFARDLADEQAAEVPSKVNKTSAAAKAPTVSNRAASERSAILDEDDKWEALPYDERVSRAIKRARQSA